MEKYTDLKLELFLKRVVEEAKPMLGEFILGDRPLHAAIFIDGTEFRWKLWKPEERSIKDEIAQALQLLATNGFVVQRKSNKEEGELIGSITINKELSKDDTLIITNTFQYDDNGKEVGKSIGYEIKKEGPKPECDHIVGVYNDYGFVLEVSQSMCSVNSDWSNYDREEFILEKKYCHSHFYFCPKKGCGAPIDWEEIAKKLNLKKDDSHII